MAPRNRSGSRATDRYDRYDDLRWRPYVPVSARRAQAASAARKLTKNGRTLAPISIQGRAMTRTFWGGAWCTNLEAYSDFSNRLPRGRTYARNGSVIDLQMTPGKITALVQGSSLYEVEIVIQPQRAPHWKAIVSECAGKVESVVELLQGRFSNAVMEVITKPGSGLFPTPAEIAMECSCPDWATLCKHVAAVLYGVGARLDERPELLFDLRRVDPAELIERASGMGLLAVTQPDVGASGLRDDQLGDVFGIDLDLGAETAPPASATKKPAPRRGALPKVGIEAKGKSQAKPAAKGKGKAAAATRPSRRVSNKPARRRPNPKG